MTRAAIPTQASTPIRCLLLALLLGGLCTQAWCAEPAPSLEPGPLQLVAASIDSPLIYPDLPCRQTHLLIAQEALRRAGIVFVCEPVAWKRAQVMVQDGERDAMVTLLTAERAEYSIASNEIVYESHMAAFISAAHPQRGQLARIKTIA